MRRGAFPLSVLVFALILFLVSPASAQKTENVTYKSGDDIVTGYLASPNGVGKHPAVMVIHEWWGLNDWVKDQAQKFAAQGYMALAVDLYRGQVAKTPDEAHVLMRGLPDDRGLRDLQAAFAYLASRPDVDAAKIGSIGWCMGGGWSIKLAEDQPKLAAFVVNYGSHFPPIRTSSPGSKRRCSEISAPKTRASRPKAFRPSRTP